MCTLRGKKTALLTSYSWNVFILTDRWTCFFLFPPAFFFFFVKTELNKYPIIFHCEWTLTGSRASQHPPGFLLNREEKHRYTVIKDKCSLNCAFVKTAVILHLRWKLMMWTIDGLNGWKQKNRSIVSSAGAKYSQHRVAFIAAAASSLFFPSPHNYTIAPRELFLINSTHSCKNMSGQ